MVDKSGLDFLNSRVNFERFQQFPTPEREFKLDRMRELLRRLGQPQEQIRIVHVTGTKGKGSTAAMIESILRAAGLRTGLFTSPHLERVEERIALGGRPLDGEAFLRLLAEVQPVVTEMDGDAAARGWGFGPTYFEILTAMAMLCFRRERVDAAVVEVGLGGRLDSTNVCTPKVSVITSISLDHTAQLGDTEAAIAREKAGIIKPGVPVVSGVKGTEAADVIRRAAHEHHAPLTELNVDFSCVRQPADPSERSAPAAWIDYYQKDLAHPVLSRLPLPLLGRHQAANAAVALATIDVLRSQGWAIDDPALYEGLVRARSPARVEVFSRRPAVILDCAHNVASVEALVETLRESFRPRRKMLLFGTTRDKDVRGMLAVVVAFFDEVVFTQYSRNPRAAPVGMLASLAEEITGRGYPTAINPHAAWRRMRAAAGPDDLLCVAGSFFLAGELRPDLVAGGERTP